MFAIEKFVKLGGYARWSLNHAFTQNFGYSHARYAQTIDFRHAIWSFPSLAESLVFETSYRKAVVKELLKRGSFPVFLSRKPVNLYSAGEGTDCFEEVGIVCYRSRRDMLAMATSPSFQTAEPHKWASMEKTVVVPIRKLMLLDPTVIVPALLFFAAAIGRSIKKGNQPHA